MLSRANSDQNLPSHFETNIFSVRGKHWVTYRLKALQFFLPGKSILIPLQQTFFSLKPLPQDPTWGLAVLIHGYHQDDTPASFFVLNSHCSLNHSSCCWPNLLQPFPQVVVTAFPHSLFPIPMRQKQIHFLFLSSLLSLIKSIHGTQGIQNKCNCNS